MTIIKHRRDVTKQAEGLEALFFPEIIDRLFANAPYPSLLALRTVCHGWRYRADDILVRHVAVRNRMGEWTIETPSGPFPRVKWNAVLHLVKHLEVHGVWCLPPHQSHFPMWIMHFEQLQSLHFKLQSGNVSMTLRPGCSRFLENRWMENNHATLCVSARTTNIPPLLHGGGIPRSLTVFIKPSLIFPGRNSTNGEIFRQLAPYLGEVLQLAVGFQTPFSITVVNLEDWYNHLQYDNGKLVFSGTIVKQARRACKNHGLFRDMIQRTLPKTSSGAAKLIAIISFLSLHEYRTKVGDDQHRLETELVE